MSKKKSVSDRPQAITTKLLWTAQSIPPSNIVEDTTWMSTFDSNSEPMRIVCKAGNQDYSLDKFLKLDPPESLDIGEKKLNISEFGLKRKYSAILPVVQFWFLIKTIEWSKKYSPVHFTILPLETALAFFDNLKQLSVDLKEKVKALANKWNNLNENRNVADIRGITERIYLSAHDYVNTEGSKGCSKVVLSITNWNWVKDVKDQSSEEYRCDQSCFTIGFKISSTSFLNVNKISDEDLYFDKQGVAIPYYDFFALLKNQQFIQFISNVRNTFKPQTDSEEKPTPDDIYINHYGTGTQPENLDEVNQAYVEEMRANGYSVPSFYPFAESVSSENSYSAEKKKAKKSKVPLSSGKRPSPLLSKETIKKLKKL